MSYQPSLGATSSKVLFFCHIGHNLKKGSLDKTTSSKVRCSQVPQPTCYWKSVESWLGNHSLDKMLSLQARFSWQNAIAGAILQVLLAKCYLAGVATARYLTVSLQSLKLLRRTSGRNYVVLKCWNYTLLIQSKSLWKFVQVFDWKEMIYLWWQVHRWACQRHLPRGSSGKCLKEWDEVLPNNRLLQTGGRL